MIVDLMDQKGTQLPRKGTQDSFSDPMQMLICGIKEHPEVGKYYYLRYRYSH